MKSIGFQHRSLVAALAVLAQGETLHQGLERDGGQLFKLTGQSLLQFAYTYFLTAESTTPFEFAQVANGAEISGSAAGNRCRTHRKTRSTTAVGYGNPRGFDANVEAAYGGEQFSDFAQTQAASADGQRGLIDSYTVLNVTGKFGLKKKASRSSLPARTSRTRPISSTVRAAFYRVVRGSLGARSTAF